MNRYIDAEKLIAEIERRMNILDKESPFGIGGRVELELVLNAITSLQQEQPMPDSTKLIELWHEDKEMLKEKDFRDDPWRLAFNAFMCGFGRGIAVNKQEQPESGCSEKPNNLREQPEVELKKEIGCWMNKLDNKYCMLVEDYSIQDIKDTARHFYELGLNARKEESVGVAESPSKTFPRVNDFECGGSYRH